MVGRRAIRGRAGRWATLLMGLAPMAMPGCGGVESEKGLVPVSGKVTLDGGPWPRPGQITFAPTNAGKSPDAAAVSAVAKFETDGSFVVGHEGSSGLKPGQYFVAVDCPEGEPEMPLPGQKVVDKNAAPKKYRNPESSGLSFDVASGKSAEANFDVKSK